MLHCMFTSMHSLQVPANAPLGIISMPDIPRILVLCSLYVAYNYSVMV